MKSIGSVEPDQLFDEGRAYFQRRERDIRRVLLETARQGEREGVISPPADEEYILLTFNSIMQGVYRTICAGYIRSRPQAGGGCLPHSGQGASIGRRK